MSLNRGTTTLAINTTAAILYDPNDTNSITPPKIVCAELPAIELICIIGKRFAGTYSKAAASISAQVRSNKAGVGALLTIDPGGGAAAFAGVVILTMLAALGFDPRLAWRRAGHRRHVTPESAKIAPLS